MDIPRFSNDANVNDGPNFDDDCDMDVEEEFVEGDISMLLMLPRAPVSDWQGYFLFASTYMIKDRVMTTPATVLPLLIESVNVFLEELPHASQRETRHHIDLVRAATLLNRLYGKSPKECEECLMQINEKNNYNSITHSIPNSRRNFLYEKENDAAL